MAIKQAKNGMFSKPKGCFSQISNKVLHSSTLSLKAKGLYSLIVSFITLPGFTLYKSYLQSLSVEGRYSFDSAWKELVAEGHLTHKRVRQSDGTFAYEYMLTSKEEVEDASLENAADTMTGRVPDVSSVFDMPLSSEAQEESKINTIENDKACQEACDVVCDPPCQLPNENTSFSTSPLPKNQPPVSYIYNNTLSNNTQSMTETQIKKELAQQMDVDYFLKESVFSSHEKLVIIQLLDYLSGLRVKSLEQETLWNETTLWISQVSSCTVMEFLDHMRQQSKIIIPPKYPVPYWNKAFLNFITQSAYELTTQTLS